jgi:hypothetical protein
MSTFLIGFRESYNGTHMKKKTPVDWRKKTLSHIRKLIKQVDPRITEEVKYKMPSNPAGIPVWYRDGMICTGETYKNHLRLTFAKKASLFKDPKGLFDAYRAIVIHEGDKINEAAFKNIIRTAVALNRKGKSLPVKKTRKRSQVRN